MASPSKTPISSLRQLKAKETIATGEAKFTTKSKSMDNSFPSHN